MFVLGEVVVENELRYNDGTAEDAGNVVALALQGTEQRQPCAICFYDSEDDSADASAEQELTRELAVPTERRSRLVVMGAGEADGGGAGSDSERPSTLTHICPHVFHTTCLYKWVCDGGFVCPVCRAGLVRQTLGALPRLFVEKTELVVVMWPNGSKREEYFERGGVRDGVAREFTEDGRLRCECTYEAGFKHGEERHYYEDTGELQSVVSFDRGRKHGVSRRYTRDGALIGELHWAYGRKEGAHTEWFVDGDQQRVHSLAHYQDDERHGVFLKWHFSGRLIMYGSYLRGQKHGRFVSWFEEVDAVRIKSFFERGVLHGYHAEYRLTTEGRVVPHEQGRYAHGLKVGPYTTFYRGGQLRSVIEYDELGRKDGLERTWWRTTGRPQRTFRWSADKLDGVAECFDKNGRALETACYKDGELHGLYVMRHPGLGTPKIIRVMRHGTELEGRVFSRTGELVWESKNGVRVPPRDVLRVKRAGRLPRGAKRSARFIE